jgi:hypothetical protein
MIEISYRGKGVQERLSPQAVAWNHVIDVYYLPALMCAKYSKTKIMQLNIGGRKGQVDKQATEIYTEHGINYLVCLVRLQN